MRAHGHNEWSARQFSNFAHSGGAARPPMSNKSAVLMQGIPAQVSTRRGKILQVHRKPPSLLWELDCQGARERISAPSR